MLAAPWGLGRGVVLEEQVAPVGGDSHSGTGAAAALLPAEPSVEEGKLQKLHSEISSP